MNTSTLHRIDRFLDHLCESGVDALLANATLIQYCVQEMFKGRQIPAIAKNVAAKFSGGENMFLGSGVIQIDAKELEAALWRYVAQGIAKNGATYKAGKEHFAIDGAMHQFRINAKYRAKLKALAIEFAGKNIFTGDDVSEAVGVSEMAATYVPITRDEFEAWLTEVWGAGNWNLRAGSAGVYRLKLGRKVSIQVSSSIGSADTNMSVGEGAIHVAMVGRVTGRTLNKKAVGKSRINRTKGWKGNLLAAVKAVEAEYNLRPNFYDAIADPEAYRSETLERIESVPGGAQSDFWRSLHDWVSSGKVLSDKQAEALMRQTKDFKPSGKPAASRPASSGGMSAAEIKQRVQAQARGYNRDTGGGNWSDFGG